ncbi:LamG-like jellyroll fold domain-containing protein [Streptomyces sp. NPDC013457]|uniref:LamG-like jellyroll fold domain-containing protein n=1 Tax=Streptomyces sp. NPDC013457 TaxID=3364866 RepID=UPI0036FDDD03
MATAASVLFGVVPAGSALAAERAEPAGATTTTATPEAERALKAARASGHRVEVTSERSERTTVFANPDGSTFTLEESAVPVRVAVPGGGWRAPDATLVRRSDGSIGPKAAAAEMSFSRGGNKDALVSIAESGRSLALEWPGRLPAPRLDGASAVYPDVLPDVDLKVTATVESFQHVLVVKTPEAAADPRIRTLTFGLRTRGLSVRTSASGALAAVDGDGRTVFKAPPAQMWDSAGRGAAGRLGATVPAAKPALAKGPAGTLVAAPSASPAPGTSADASESAPSGTGRAPGQGDKVRGMGVKLGKGSLSVMPDAAMLANTPDAAFPLFIDPTVTWGESERTLLRSDGYESYGWGNGDDDRGMGAGKCGSWNGYYCGPGYVQRLYFEFSPASLKGKNILDATFRVTEPWAFQCDPRTVDLVRTDNISSSTTWTTRPKELDWMVDRDVSAGRGSLCDPDSPDAPIEFNDNPAETNENLTPTVKSFAAGKFSRLTLEIRANNESDTSAWKRFRNDAVLSVKFVALPALPTGVGVVSGNGTVCAPNENDPAVISDPTPAVNGRPQTAAGGESGASLRIRWRTQKWNGTSWVTAHTDVDSPTTGYTGDNVNQTKSLPALAEGVKHRLLALTLSYYEDGTNRLNTGYTAACHFTVDTTAPKAPKVTMGAPYSECLPNACAAAGGPGVSSTVTFAPAVGDTNITNVQYRSTEQAAWINTCSPGVACTFKATVTPNGSGTHRLYVRAVDSLGRAGAQQVVDYLVASGDGPVGRWSFGEASGAAVDTGADATRQDAALAGTAVRDDRGRRGELTTDAAGAPLPGGPVTDRGLLLNGGGHAATSAPVLETRSGYSFSTWVRLDSKDTTGVVLSQDGANYSPFVVTYEKPYDTWYFGVKEKDEATADAYWGRKAVTPARTGVWTHLAGTYDPAAKTLQLFVNGKLEAVNTNVVSSWSATGPMQFGRYRYNGQYGLPFKGSIDEVAVWQRVLTAREIAEEAKLPTSQTYAGAELVADWNAADATGSTVPNSAVGYGPALTLSGGAAVAGGEIVLDGVDDAATAAGPVLDDTGSFTATTTVRLDSAQLLTKPVGHTGQVFGQRSASGSAWGFWFQLTGKETALDPETMEERTTPVGKWHFGRLNADGTFSSVVSDEVAAMDSLVRLTGVFDAQDGAISLYLGHNRNGEATAFTAQVGSGDFALGKGFTSGGWGHHLPARIAEVRLWAGAMAGADQIETTVGD